MALEIDGAAVLRAIVAQPHVFPDLGGELAKAARSLVVRQLKAKGTTIDGVRAVRTSVGVDPFALIVDGLTDADVRALAAKLDGGHAELATATPEWCRRHLIALASAASEPAEPRVPTRRALPSQAETGSLRHESVQARPKRRSKR